MNEAEQASLVASWRSGDRGAGDRLMRHFYPQVLRFFEHRTRAAEDLTQRTLLGAAEGLERFRGESSFRAYVFGIARRQLLTYLNDAKRRSKLAEFGPRGPLTSLSTIVARQQEQQTLLRAMAELPEHTQTLLGLFYWDEMAGPEIGAVLGIAHSAVTTRLARARVALRDAIAALPGVTDDTRAALHDDEELERWFRSLARKRARLTMPGEIP